MDGDDIVVGGAKVVAPDIMASNGVIHAVDSVIAKAERLIRRASGPARTPSIDELEIVG